MSKQLLQGQRKNTIKPKLNMPGKKSPTKNNGCGNASIDKTMGWQFITEENAKIHKKRLLTEIGNLICVQYGMESDHAKIYKELIHEEGELEHCLTQLKILIRRNEDFI